jgi:hypothetical protein
MCQKSSLKIVHIAQGQKSQFEKSVINAIQKMIFAMFWY